MAGRIVLIASLLRSSQALSGSGFDPADPGEPFDAASQAVSSWLKEEVVVPRKKDGWQSLFCECVQNGDIASWFQMAPSLYVVDTCSQEDGFVLRSGHLQDRHVEPLQAMMSCDVLKLISYCFAHTAPEALPMWQPQCNEAHYTSPSCDVDCSSAVRLLGSLSASFAVFVALVGLM
eukprot:TRINITY_DN87168_c0_g1_i1.p1 TRINITY_DN87168_c0_g1~~TRINITY_DN87168_c0_g1_i1.p1  ORF type:complete len:176 (-),score=38.22 TRINITY_DN87168_c0_g1_i1:49-576(-)